MENADSIPPNVRGPFQAGPGVGHQGGRPPSGATVGRGAALRCPRHCYRDTRPLPRQAGGGIYAGECCQIRRDGRQGIDSNTTRRKEGKKERKRKEKKERLKEGKKERKKERKKKGRIERGKDRKREG